MSYVKKTLNYYAIASMKLDRNFTDNGMTISHAKVNLHYKRTNANVTDFLNQKIISHMSMFLKVRFEMFLSL